MSKLNILDMLAPNDCINCGKQGEIVCNDCLPDYLSLSISECFRCNKKTLQSKLCSGCYKVLKINRLWSVCQYSKASKQIINNLKFRPNRSVASKIAQLMDVVVPHDNWMVIPLPTAPKRVRQRGFDHAKLIAKEFTKLRNLESADVLLRTSNVRQVGTKKAERLRQTQKMYSVDKINIVRAANVLLIDDVVTTGASLSEATKALKKAGAKSVCAAVFAVARQN